jgi:hypothetical protein
MYGMSEWLILRFEYSATAAEVRFFKDVKVLSSRMTIHLEYLFKEPDSAALVDEQDWQPKLTSVPLSHNIICFSSFKLKKCGKKISL